MRTYWFEVAVVAAIFAVGNICLGHFEERTPKWRRVAKFAVVTGLFVGASAVGGRAWFYGLPGAAAAGFAIVHGWWLPRQGVHGWTGEPRERYYRLRGWAWPPAGAGRADAGAPSQQAAARPGPARSAA